MTRPAGELVVSYGGGVNSVAMLVYLASIGEVPTSIYMANPGAEWSGTMAYLENVMRPWLAHAGFPSPVVISRKDEGEHRPRSWRLETLAEECERTASLPSVAYGWKKCSLKYKAEPQRWRLQRTPWLRGEIDAGRKIVRAIGYDFDESSRLRDTFGHEWEAKHFVPWYPLYEARIDRAGCERLIATAGLPAPTKSACTYCPNNTLEDWIRLREEEPEAFAAAVAMSRRAESTITDPDVVGLMRCNPHGRRQLHVWADGGYESAPSPQLALGLGDTDAMPCECAL